MDERYNNNFLYFEEDGHKYYDTLGNNYISVTTLIHDKYVPKFDKNYWLHRKAKELGLTEKKLAKEWQNITDEACNRGTVTHNGIEDAIKSVSMFENAIKYLTEVKSGRKITVADIPNLIPKPLNIKEFKEATNNKYAEIYRVFDFYTSKGYTIYSEIGAYLMDYCISGTIDILCYKADKFVILDWKTNRQGLQFTSGYYKKDKHTKPNQLTNEWIDKDDCMLPPLNNLPDCNGSHYTMQLSIYALMTELILGIPCVGLGLCHIGSPFIKNAWGQPRRFSDAPIYRIDDKGEETVKWFKINYLRKEACAVLEDRRLELQNNNINKELNLFE